MPRFLRTGLALLHKEWRDVRAVTLACALLVPLGLLALDYAYLDWRGDFAARYYVPGCVAIYLAIVAADIVAADLATRRARAMAALPVRWAEVWLAKLTFLVLAGVGFALWTIASCSTLYEALAPEAQNAKYIDELSRFSHWVALIGAFVVATTVFWSTVLERGFAVVGAALVTCAAIGGTLPLLNAIDPELLPAESSIQVCLVALPVVFLLGSLYAFVGAPHHASSVWRRLTLAGIIPVVVLVPTGAVGAAVLAERLVVTPGDPTLTIVLGHVSPDGRRLVVRAAGQHEGARLHTWILDLEDGSLATLPHRGLETDWNTPFTADGNYVAWSRTKNRDDDLRRVYDPETGETLETRSTRQLGDIDWYWFRQWATTEVKGADLVVTLRATEEERRLPASRAPSLSRIPGYALHTQDNAVHLHDLVSDTTTILRTDEQSPSAHFSPNGEFVSTWSGGIQILYDTRTGEEVRRLDSYVGFLGGNSPDAILISFYEPSDAHLIDIESGAIHPLPMPSGVDQYGLHRVRVLPNRRVVRVTHEGRIEISDMGGGNSRTLYPPREVN